MGRKAIQVEGSGQMNQSRVTEAPWICCVSAPLTAELPWRPGCAVTGTFHGISNQASTLASLSPSDQYYICDFIYIIKMSFWHSVLVRDPQNTEA